jgi:hypothetical protein
MKRAMQEAQGAKVPAQPQVGEADPLAALGPATSTVKVTVVDEPSKIIYPRVTVTTSGEEKNIPKTSADLANATPVANAEEVEQLDQQINAVALSIVGEFQGRVETELLPLLYRMRSILPHGQWGRWYDAFCERHRIQWSIRTVQRKFQQLEDGWNEIPARTTGTRGGCIGGRGKGTLKTPEQIAAEKEYIDTVAQLQPAADGGNEQAKAIIADAKAKMDAVYNAAVAATGTAMVKDKPSAETRVNKRLASIVEIAERYIRVMERVVHTTPQTDRQKDDIEKARKSWRKVLQDARTLSWAVQVIEKQGEEEEAA